MDKYAMTNHKSNNWCHICGENSERLIDIFYPQCANRSFASLDSVEVKYIRICSKCSKNILSTFPPNALK